MNEVDRQAIIRVKQKLANRYKPDARIFWGDLLLSSCLGWMCFVGSLLAPVPWLAGASFFVGLCALYRSLIFTHELEHFQDGALPGFRGAFHLLLGMPLCLPHFMYRGVHRIHHSTRYYGTLQDPEYMPFVADRSYKQPIIFLILILLSPIVLSTRFLVLAPLSLLSKKLRENIEGKASGFVLRLDYTRAIPTGTEKRAWLLEEFSTTLFAWSVLGAVYLGFLPARLLLHWYALVASILFVLAIRGLTATHRYASKGEVLDFAEHIYDSVNLQKPSLVNRLVLPIGLNLHATHHVFPGLPYYALPEAHRLLMEESLAEGEPLRSYVAGQWSDFPTSIGNLVRLVRDGERDLRARSEAEQPLGAPAFPDF